MLVKFLKAKHGGGIGAVNYCLNERKANGTARLLKGDEALTRAIIATMPYKQKTTFCVLSFSEKADEISEADKQAIIADFEKYLLCGMESRVNTLWIEHSDKNGRLELNCIIPKIDIVSGKSFNPYYAKYDQTRINSWQEVTNFQYGFSDPKDQNRQRAVQVLSKGKNYLQNYKDATELNNFFIEQVANGNINSKAEILEMLKDADFQIKRDGVRGGTPYLSLETKDKIKIVLKGDIYSDEFINREFIQAENIERREAERNIRASKRSNIKRIEDETRRLLRLYERRKKINAEKCQRSPRSDERIQGGISESNSENPRDNSTSPRSDEQLRSDISQANSEQSDANISTIRADNESSLSEIQKHDNKDANQSGLYNANNSDNSHEFSNIHANKSLELDSVAEPNREASQAFNHRKRRKDIFKIELPRQETTIQRKQRNIILSNRLKAIRADYERFIRELVASNRNIRKREQDAKRREREAKQREQDAIKKQQAIIKRSQTAIERITDSEQRIRTSEQNERSISERLQRLFNDAFAGRRERIKNGFSRGIATAFTQCKVRANSICEQTIKRAINRYNSISERFKDIRNGITSIKDGIKREIDRRLKIQEQEQEKNNYSSGLSWKL